MSHDSKSVAEFLAQWLELVVQMFVVDLEELSEEQIYRSIGGSVRTPHHIAAEVAMLMDWIARTLQGETVPSPTDVDQLAFMERGKSKVDLVKLVQDTGREFHSALQAASTEWLDTEVATPFGGTRKVIQLANIYINHTWYHDGQLNVIQAFHGDTEVHW